MGLVLGLTSITGVIYLYQGVQRFLPELIQSLNKQTMVDWDLVVFNTATRTDFSSYLSELEVEYTLVDVNVETIPKQREFSINWLVENGYKFVIWFDSDDFYDKRRVELTYKHLKSHPIVFNDINIVDESGRILVKDYFNGRVPSVVDFDFIKDKNCLGFGNSGVDVRLLEGIEIPRYVIAVDWYVYTILLWSGYRARFIPMGLTFYRQYGGNIVGFRSVTFDRLMHVYKAKKAHYTALVGVIPQLKRELEELELKKDKILNAYKEGKLIDLLEQMPKNLNFLWWEELNYV